MASGLEAVPVADDVASPVVESLRFEFTGTAGEYMRIWLVNLALTIATLGIYSAWAKVRTLRYFYGNTTVGGSSFAYLAQPKQILKGRLIAVGVFVLFSIAADLHPALGISFSLASLVFAPWLIARALAFRARHTSFRNIRLAFQGSSGEAAQAYVLYPVLVSVSLGMLYPVARCRQAHFVIDNARFGSTPFRYDASARDYYRVCARIVRALLASAVVVALVPDLWWLAIPFVLYGSIDVATGLSNLWYNATTLGEHRFRSSLRPSAMAWLYFTNTLAVAVSLGVLLPWARVRTARYRASRLEILAVGGLDGFLAGEAAETSALGEGFADVFDLDVGF
jgi:uncharacterized membrane protein YjgN (DUF898 family)